ncbi:hypothetical protein [Salinigranum marinum]|uniref:hypothetical protein n=1 Tax=Salinigranum marinum TaxID=1515595 RepID=UPI002989DB99|nr:hypothetical protein [Salinigranum marinum]
MIERRKLERWTKAETADQDEARDTQRAIRDELEEGRLEGVSDGLEFATYLQGSYRNTTMVYDSGDVDILVIRTDKYHADFSDTPETSAEHAPTQNPRQMFEEHAEGVYRTLQAQYGTRSVERGDKAIEVDSKDLPLGADVVPCLQYRRFWPRQSGNHMKGIVFWTAEGTKVVNFPRRHRIMGEQYNGWCAGNYKSTVRVLKNFRNTLVANGTIEKEDAPSYFVECLLSNVEVSTIAHGDIRDRIEGVFEELESAAEGGFPDYTVQHGMSPLFGEKSTQWNTDQAEEFVRAARTLYEED